MNTQAVELQRFAQPLMESHAHPQASWTEHPVQLTDISQHFHSQRPETDPGQGTTRNGGNFAQAPVLQKLVQEQEQQQLSGPAGLTNKVRLLFVYPVLLLVFLRCA